MFGHRSLALRASAAAFVLLGLSGCSGSPSSGDVDEDVVEAESGAALETAAEPAPETATSTPDPAQESEPPAAPLEIPGCETMNPRILALHEEGREGRPTMNSFGEIDLQQFQTYAGPTAQEAMTAAVQVRGCYYPIHFELATYQWVAELPAQEQQALITGLEADSSINRYQLGDALAFDYVVPLMGVNDSMTVSYVFAGDVWITMFDGAAIGGLDASSVGELLGSVTDLNPELELSIV